MNNDSEFVSVKEACKLLKCGRTKIYTHYINNGILSIKKKVGNRSFFLRSDIEAILDSSSSEDSQQRTLSPIYGDLRTQSYYEEPDENDGNESMTISPPQSKQEQEALVTDYIVQLKNQIAELESELDHTKNSLNTYKAKLLNTISLVEYKEKMQQKEKTLAETEQRLLEYNEQKTELENKLASEQQEKQTVQQNFDSSIKVAEFFKSQLDETMSRNKQLARIHQRLHTLHTELEDCNFFAFSRKRELKDEIRRLLEVLQQFDD